VDIVIVGEPELASINTSSADVGTEAAGDPPEEDAHLEVEVQLPVPPTQYLFAIYLFIFYYG
jgi:hypothetical protein